MSDNREKDFKGRGDNARDNQEKVVSDELFEKIAADKRRKLDEFLKGLEKQEQAAKRSEDMRQTIHHDLFNKELKASHKTQKAADGQLQLDLDSQQAPRGVYKEKKAPVMQEYLKASSDTVGARRREAPKVTGEDLTEDADTKRIPVQRAAPVVEPQVPEEDDVKIYKKAAVTQEKPAVEPVLEEKPEEDVRVFSARDDAEADGEPVGEAFDADADDAGRSTQELLLQARKRKMDGFVLNPDMEGDEEQGGEFEFTRASDAGEILGDLRKWRKKRLFKLCICAVCFLISLVIVLAPALPSGIFGYSLKNETASQTVSTPVNSDTASMFDASSSSAPFVSETAGGREVNADTDQVRVIILMLLVINIIVFAVSFDTISGGFVDFFRLSASQDSAAALVWLFTVIHCVVLLIAPDKDSFVTGIYGVYAPMGAFAAALAHLSVFLRQCREINGFETISSGSPSLHLQLHNEGVSCILERPAEDDEEDACAATFREAEFSSDYFAISDSEDGADRINRVVVPAAVAVGLLVGVLAIFLNGYNARYFLPVCTAVVCSVMPVASGIACLYPQVLCSLANKKREIAVANQTAFDEAFDMSSVVVSDTDIYTAQTMVLNGVKTFGGKKMDEVIVLAASAASRRGGPLKEMFANILSENEGYLLEVENETAFEPENGLVCWIGGKRVILGRREFVEQYDLVMPDREFEQKYAKRSRGLLYLACGGELAGLLVVTYKPDPQARESLRALARRGIKIVVSSNDPGLTAEMVARQLGLEQDFVVILDSRGREVLEKLSEPAETLPAGIVCRGGLHEKVKAITSCFKLRKMVSVGFAFQTGMLVLGLVLNLLMIKSAENLGLPLILGFQACWVAILVILQSFGGYHKE